MSFQPNLRVLLSGEEDSMKQLKMSQSDYLELRKTNLTAHSYIQYLEDAAKLNVQYGKYENSSDDKKDHLLLGEMIHVGVLEGMEAFNERFVIFDPPINLKTKKPYTEGSRPYKAGYNDLKAKTSDFKTIVTGSVYSKAVAILNEWKAKPCAACCAKQALWPIDDWSLNEDFSEPAKEKCFIETTFLGSINGIKVCSRLDYLFIDREAMRIKIIDLKTTRSLSLFKEQIENFGYRKQLNFYAAMAKKFYSEMIRPEFDLKLVAIETTPPYTSAVFNVEYDRKFDLDYETCKLEEKINNPRICHDGWLISNYELTGYID